MDRLEWLPRVALVGAPAQLIPRSYLVFRTGRPAGLLAGPLIGGSSPFADKGRKKASFLRPKFSIYR